MAKGINKVILIGNLGADPEVRHSPAGATITTISLATTDTWRDKQTGEQQERTEWHRIVFFSGLAKIAGEYLKKASKVYVEGSLRTRKWTDKNGIERYTTEIVGNEMQMLDKRGGGGFHQNHDFTSSNRSSDANTQKTNHFNQGHHDASSQQASAATAHTTQKNEDDDIPF